LAFSAVGRDAWLSIDSCTLPRLTAEDAKNAEHFADADLDHVDQSKAENHAAAVALIFPWCNFVRVHQTLRVTPAMEAGIADHFWSLDELWACSMRVRRRCRNSS
jgi:hypothetical protein